ncbi:transmembrane and coiled-coil domain-containing protein 6 isoform X6 [Ciconia boyciana]|uniref:transmembrane and coiled-coil domain-containing protein 6 isoform X6 n=1 Tax=Ciconia boyciana TaxID=52775 RepID=UPI003BA12AEC
MPAAPPRARPSSASSPRPCPLRVLPTPRPRGPPRPGLSLLLLPAAMWGRRRYGAGLGGRGAEELRARRREREAALRKARRQEQLVSKRLLREDTTAEEGGQDGAEIMPDPLSEDEVLELLRGVQSGSEDRKRSLSCLRWALRNKETQQKFVRLEGSIRTLIGLFTSSLADMQMEAARCLHELSHSSDPAVAEACLPVTSYLLTYLSGHSIEFTSPHEAVLEGLGYVLSQLLQAKEAPTEIIPHTANTALLSLGALPALTSLLLDLASEIPEDAPEGLELLICPVLRCLSNLLAEETGCEVQIQDERLLIALFLILQCFLQQHPFIVQECLWLLNNLTADEHFFCSALLSLDLLPALLQLLPCSQMASMLVLTILCNIAEKGPAYCQQLHQQPALPLLLPTLALPDPKVVGQCLELLHLLFLHWPEAAADFVRQGGHQALEQHQSTPELQERARALLDIIGQPLGASAFSPCHAMLSAFS